MIGIFRGEKMLQSTYKVPGGKLVKIRLEVQNSRIERLVILGDFFMHPEDALPNLEKSLIGANLNGTEITQRVATFLDRNNVLLIGVSPADIATAILMAK